MTGQHRLEEDGYIGAHRACLTKRQQIVGTACRHLLHATYFTMAGMPPILFFETIRPVWEVFVHVLHI